jgi:hypothetical protein
LAAGSAEALVARPALIFSGTERYLFPKIETPRDIEDNHRKLEPPAPSARIASGAACSALCGGMIACAAVRQLVVMVYRLKPTGLSDSTS